MTNPKRIKWTVLSISSLTILGTAAVAPAIGQIADYFPEANEIIIKMILAMPPILVIIFSFISNLLTNFLNKRNIILTGLFLYLIGGCFAGIANNIVVLLLFRALLGVGIGLILPLSTSIISDLFSGLERTKMIGYSTAATSFGGMICLLLSGQLTQISWRATFLIYVLSALVMLLVWFNLPSLPKKSSVVKHPLPKHVYKLAFGMLLLFIAFYTIPTSIDIYIRKTGLGDGIISSLIIAVGTITGFVSGLTLPIQQKLLGRFLSFTQLVILATGFIIIGYTHSVVLLIIGSGCVGFMVNSLITSAYSNIALNVEEEKRVQANGLIGSMIFLGQFLSPIIIDSVSWISKTNSVQFQYQFLGISISILSLIVFVKKALLNRLFSHA